MKPGHIQFIKDCKNKFDLKINKDILYSSAIEDILKDSLDSVDYKLNWNKIDTYEKLYFLYFILAPINEATTYKELFNIVYNQHSMNSVFRNSILLMFEPKV